MLFIAGTATKVWFHTIWSLNNFITTPVFVDSPVIGKISVVVLEITFTDRNIEREFGLICNATLCQKTWGTTFTGTWSKNWQGRYWVIMCKPFVLQASSSCLCFSLGLEEINESPESWMLLEETARFPLFLHPEWHVSNNVPAYSAQCKTTNVSRAFIQQMYPLHNNGGCQKCAPCHSDEWWVY